MKQSKNYMYLPVDRKCIQRLEGFLPDRVFDMHAHIWIRDFIPDFVVPGGAFSYGPAVFDTEVFWGYMKDMYPGAKVLRANFLAWPDGNMVKHPENMVRFNEFLAAEISKHPENTGAIIVMPGMSGKYIESFLTHPNIKGFKCYHSTAPVDVTFNADIGDYLPESAWEVANERNLYITLHMVKDNALSDPDNLKYIIAHCKKYANANLILAHAARGFCYFNTMDSIHALSGLDNVYFDTGAVCEPEAMVAIIKEFGPSRLMWGSDNPAAMLRGKCITVGESFLWIYTDSLPENISRTGFDATLIGIESLLAVKRACEYTGLSRCHIEDIFYNNAVRMMGIN